MLSILSASTLFSGLRCHLEDACKDDPCNSAAMSCETSPMNGDYICECKPGKTGKDCSQDVNECNESKYN